MLNTFFFTFISCAVIAYDISTHGSLECKFFIFKFSWCVDWMFVLKPVFEFILHNLAHQNFSIKYCTNISPQFFIFRSRKIVISFGSTMLKEISIVFFCFSFTHRTLSETSRSPYLCETLLFDCRRTNSLFIQVWFVVILLHFFRL